MLLSAIRWTLYNGTFALVSTLCHASYQDTTLFSSDELVLIIICTYNIICFRPSVHPLGIFALVSFALVSFALVSYALVSFRPRVRIPTLFQIQFKIISIRLHFDPILLYSHANLPINTVDRFDYGVFQVLFCFFETVNMCFAVVYRPPDAIVSSFTDDLQLLAKNRHYTGFQWW